MRSFRSVLATASVTLLALSGAVVAASPAVAASEEARPGAESPTATGNSAWNPSNPVTSIAQQFVQPETGNLDTMSIGVFDFGSGYEFTSAAIHTFEPGVGPSESPIPGGEGGVVTYTADSSLTTFDFPSMWATIDFPNLPVLEADTRYALVMDPLVNDGSGNYASFVNQFSSDPNFDTWERRGNAWGGYSTSHTIFKSQLVTVIEEEPADGDTEGEPAEPTEPTEPTPPTAPTAPERVETAAL